MKELLLPTSDVTDLEAGEWLNLSGIIYTARDQAHQRMLQDGVPFSLKGQAIYYAGPCPAKPTKISGPIGPTTSSRMDPFTPFLLKEGLKVMLGKGQRSQAVKEAIKLYKAVYLVTAGGAGTYIASKVKEIQVVAYPDLGSEAVHKLIIKDLPVLVAIDTKGNSIFQN